MMFAPVPTIRQYDCPHEAELAEYRKLTRFLNYKKACLLLCMTSYAELPEPDSSAAYRDTLTSNAVTSLGYFTTTLNMGHAASVNPGIHCYGNLNNLERLKVSMAGAWPAYHPSNDDIIVDNVRMPAGYVRNVLKVPFYKDVMNDWLDKKTTLLAPGGKIWLPNLPDVTDHLYLVNRDLLEGGLPVFVEDPFESPLIQGRELVKDRLQGLNGTDYTKLTGLPASFPFIVLQKKFLAVDDKANSPPASQRVSQKRNNPRDVPAATPHPSSSAKRARWTTAGRCSSSSSEIIRSWSDTSTCTTSSSSSNAKPHAVIDLTCDCSDSIEVKKPRACSICIGTPSSSGGKVGFTP